MNLPQGKTNVEAVVCLDELAEGHYWSSLDPTTEVQAQEAGVFVTA